MLYLLFPEDHMLWLTFAAVVISFLLTFVLTLTLKSKLPTDIGRAFAVNALAAKGKPRGAGIIFVCTSVCLMFLFMPLTAEHAIYNVLLILAMLSGYLDDASKSPWGEYKKGLIDLLISFFIAFTYVMYNGSAIRLLVIGTEATLPVWLYIILGTILVWASINVTNCTDGVDGLSSSLSIISLGGFAYAMTELGSTDYRPAVLIFAAAIAAYLIFNASPSILLMGDAGSRAIGVFFAICAMKTGAPLLFIPLCLVFIIDGGLGLIKVALLRFLKIRILVNTRTPIHDHMRKNKLWSDTHTVIRFAVFHLFIVFVSMYLLFVI
ncbi:MAG: phospho-N-acetylmuramoyl-pentapeptide-transferase [Lachnospiraceae bacterium]|nr:phospho-N-acetylmuramoyl-pentapeptide-transferase [Lachnospiraceae bacterium]